MILAQFLPAPTPPRFIASPATERDSSLLRTQRCQAPGSPGRGGLGQPGGVPQTRTAIGLEEKGERASLGQRAPRVLGENPPPRDQRVQVGPRCRPAPSSHPSAKDTGQTRHRARAERKNARAASLQIPSPASTYPIALQLPALWALPFSAWKSLLLPLFLKMKLRLQSVGR